MGGDSLMPSVEAVALVGGALWVLAAIVTGVPRGRVPSEFPFLFAVVGMVGALVGTGELVAEPLDIWVTGLAVLIYAIAPVVFAGWLLHRYDPDDDNEDRDGPKTIT